MKIIIYCLYVFVADYYFLLKNCFYILSVGKMRDAPVYRRLLGLKRVSEQNQILICKLVQRALPPHKRVWNQNYHNESNGPGHYVSKQILALWVKRSSPLQKKWEEIRR